VTERRRGMLSLVPDNTAEHQSRVRSDVRVSFVPELDVVRTGRGKWKAELVGKEFGHE
jgi:hypothetical protein